MDIELRNKILTIVFGIIIIALTFWLYDSLVTPYQKVKDREAMTEKVRQRLLDTKDALIQYQTRNSKFPPTEGGLDSLVHFLKTDSLMIVMGDSLFGTTFDTFNPDSLVYSPRPPHPRFEYTLNDTLRPNIYLLQDPGSDDSIGSLERTTMRNAPNWN
jgi:type II secretory pathway pseudopilin PulG